ncbi:MAG: hypothetical protein ACYTHM_22530 [Planctomycetota bacterium]|jgi:hypothetical protein
MKIRLPLFIALLGTAVIVGACQEGTVSRETYIQYWVLATLRAREKGTEPQEELGKILAFAGVSREVFEEAQVRWMEEETLQEIRQAIRKTLETADLPSRSEYVRARVLAFLRSRVRRTSLAEEVKTYGEVQGFSYASFQEASCVWTGDGETDVEIQQLYKNLEGGVTVSWEVWCDITSTPEWKAGRRSDPWFAERLEKHGIRLEDWEAAEEIHEAFIQLEEAPDLE